MPKYLCSHERFQVLFVCRSVQRTFRDSEGVELFSFKAVGVDDESETPTKGGILLNGPTGQLKFVRVVKYQLC